jgi:hypothetical protein
VVPSRKLSTLVILPNDIADASTIAGRITQGTRFEGLSWMKRTIYLDKCVIFTSERVRIEQKKPGCFVVPETVSKRRGRLVCSLHRFGRNT